MKRIEVYYGGHPYVIVDREVSDVQEEVTAILTSKGVGWIEALDGQTAAGPVRLLVTSGVDIVLIPVTPSADD